jgi:hypothetical protein
LNPVAGGGDHWIFQAGSRETQMSELLSGILASIVRAISFAVDVAVSISNAKRFSRWVTGISALVAVPVEPRILTPAAARALAEAERRHRFLYLPHPGRPSRLYAASGTAHIL